MRGVTQELLPHSQFKIQRVELAAVTSIFVIIFSIIQVLVFVVYLYGGYVSRCAFPTSLDGLSLFGIHE